MYLDDLRTNPLAYFNNEAHEEEFNGEKDDEELIGGLYGGIHVSITFVTWTGQIGDDAGDQTACSTWASNLKTR